MAKTLTERLSNLKPKESKAQIIKMFAGTVRKRKLTDQQVNRVCDIDRPDISPSGRKKHKRLASWRQLVQDPEKLNFRIFTHLCIGLELDQEKVLTKLFNPKEQERVLNELNK